MRDDGELAGQGDLGLLLASPLGDGERPALESAGVLDRLGQDDVRSSYSALRTPPSPTFEMRPLISVSPD